MTGTINQPLRVCSFAEFEAHFGKLATGNDLAYAVSQFFLNGGTEAWVLRLPDNPGEEHWLEGIRLLDLVDSFSLLVLPGVACKEIIAAATQYCEKRRAFLIIDSPADAKKPEQIEIGELNRSPNAAVYYPWLKLVDPVNNGLLRLVPPSGTVAGVLARTDSTRGVWKAPAGTDANLIGVQRIGIRSDRCGR